MFNKSTLLAKAEYPGAIPNVKIYTANRHTEITHIVYDCSNQTPISIAHTIGDFAISLNSFGPGIWNSSSYEGGGIPLQAGESLQISGGSNTASKIAVYGVLADVVGGLR